MRKPRVKSPDAPQEAEKPRSSSSGATNTLLGLATACTLATGCASDPAVRPGPPPLEPCPAGAIEAMEKLGIELPSFNDIWLPGYTVKNYLMTPIPVREGRQEVLIHPQWWKGLPEGTVLVGDFFISDRLYARFFELKTPSGDRFPFCAILRDKNGGAKGVAFLPDSKPGAMLVQNPRAYVTTEYEEY